MEGVVDIESPFCKRGSFAEGASLSVIQGKNGDGQDHRHLQKAVERIDRHTVYCRIQGYIEHHPKHLCLEISSVCSNRQDTKGGNAAPIGGKGDDAYENGQQYFQGRLDLGAVGYSQQNQAPCQRPHNTCLVQNVSRIKGNEGLPSRLVGKGKQIGEMGNKGKKKQTGGIFADIFRVVIAFRYEIAHDGAGDPSYYVQDKRKRLPRISGEKYPCNMVTGHCQDGNELYGVGV